MDENKLPLGYEYSNLLSSAEIFLYAHKIMDNIFHTKTVAMSFITHIVLKLIQLTYKSGAV